MSNYINTKKVTKCRSNNGSNIEQRFQKMKVLLQEFNKFDETYSLDYIKKCAFAMSLAFEYAFIPNSKMEEDLIAKKKKIFKDICVRCIAFSRLTDITLFNYEYIMFIYQHLIQIVKYPSMSRNDFVNYFHSINDNYLNIATINLVRFL